MLGEETQFVLANAVYFRGNWQLGFDEAETTEGVFHSPLGPRTVHLMSAEKVFPVAELPELDARALLMPYQVRTAAGVLQTTPPAVPYVRWTYMP